MQKTQKPHGLAVEARALLEVMRRAFNNAVASFAVRERTSTMKLAFNSTHLDTFAVRKDLWLSMGRKELARGNIDPLLFSAMTSALTHRHRDSGYNRVDYVRRVVDLFCAKSMRDLESLSGSGKFPKKITQVVTTVGIEAAKILIFIDDVAFGSKGQLKPDEMYDLLRVYNTPDQDAPRPRKRDEVSIEDGHRVQATFSAFEKRELYPLLHSMVQRRLITDEQVCLLLCINFHSRERRKSGERYIDHPINVARLTMKFAQVFGLTERDRQIAMMIALIHDIGEKSNFDMSSDLAPLITDKELIRSAACLHKYEDEAYFEDYIETKCVSGVPEAFTKLCDSFHNCSDATYDRISIKQAYVYPLVANYLRDFLETRRRKSIETFVQENGICSPEQLTLIKQLTEKDSKFTLAEVAARIPQLRNIIPVSQIFSDEPSNSLRTTISYAHLQRTESTAVHRRPDV